MNLDSFRSSLSRPMSLSGPRFAGSMVAKQLPNSVESGVGTSYLGHSFGGAAALEACRTDTRCAVHQEDEALAPSAHHWMDG